MPAGREGGGVSKCSVEGIRLSYVERSLALAAFLFFEQRHRFDRLFPTKC